MGRYMESKCHKGPKATQFLAQKHGCDPNCVDCAHRDCPSVKQIWQKLMHPNQ